MKYASLKNEWEQKSEGRFEKGIAAMNYYNNKALKVTTLNEAQGSTRR
jgi:hypothetical protein